MTHIVHLALENFGPFRGEHELELRPITYAVVARTEEDADDSNGRGKSTILKAVGFALFGEHWARYDDGWISDGEAEGAVRLKLDGAPPVERARKRGKATRLEFDGASGDAAQAAIERAIGVAGWADYRNRAYFEQKQMARFVTCDPGDRAAVVDGWLGLEPLDACGKNAGRRLGDTLDVVQRARAKLDAEEAALAAEAARLLGEGGAEQIAERYEMALRDAEALTGELGARVVELEAKEVAFAQRQRDREDAGQYAAVVEEGKRLKAEVEGLPAAQQARNEAGAALAIAHVEHARADRELAQKGELGRGEFDGRCPVAGIACPARDEINGRTRQNAELHQVARKRADDASTAHARAAGAVDSAEAAVLRLQRLQGRVDELRKQAVALKPASSRVAAGTVLEEDPFEGQFHAQWNDQRDKLAAARARLAELRAARARHAGKQAELATLREAADAAERHAARCREAVQVFGAAKRRVASGAVSAIEAGANDLLQQSGVGLQITVQWCREGKGLATECAACGHPFPKSAREKVCARCSAERGPKLQRRLDLELSRGNGCQGAADDLAGVAFQLSAAAWLRAERGGRLGFALLDEPLGSLDKSKRKAFAGYLARGLGVLGIKQAFVVAHQADAVAMMPGRIEVVSDGKWSRVLRVVG